MHIYESTRLIGFGLLLLGMVWRFGEGLTLVALPGEGMADYVELVGRRLRSRNVWVSSYNNDCFGYLPTAQVVREGATRRLA